MDSIKTINETIEMLHKQGDKLVKEQQKAVDLMSELESKIYKFYEPKVKPKNISNISDLYADLKKYSNDYVVCMKYCNQITELPSNDSEIIEAASSIGKINDKGHFLNVVKNVL